MTWLVCKTLLDFYFPHLCIFLLYFGLCIVKIHFPLSFSRLVLNQGILDT